jgi:hypothetical protein
VKVVVDMNKNVDFSTYKTYSFLGWQNNADKDLSVEDKNFMRSAFIKEFERRDLKKVDSGGDMQISLYIITSEETAVSGYNDYVGGAYGGTGGYNHYGGGYGYGYGSTGNTYKTRGKMVGTLIMNVYDKQSKDQIWQAIASGAVTEKPEKREKTIPAKISTIMNSFPVKPK